MHSCFAQMQGKLYLCSCSHICRAGWSKGINYYIHTFQVLHVDRHIIYCTIHSDHPYNIFFPKNHYQQHNFIFLVSQFRGKTSDIKILPTVSNGCRHSFLLPQQLAIKRTGIFIYILLQTEGKLSEYMQISKYQFCISQTDRVEKYKRRHNQSFYFVAI